MDSKYRAFAQRTLDMDCTTHRFYKLLCNIHTQACTDDSTVAVQVKAFIRIKYLADLFFRHALSGIAYDQYKSAVFF
jgi:hypothetical protein